MVKEKPNSIRIYDEEGFRRRAACICVRSDAETEVSGRDKSSFPLKLKHSCVCWCFHGVCGQVLLVTSSRRPDNWIVPGGGVEPEEEPSVTAMREVLEEAGVIGKLGRCLGVFEVPNPPCLFTITLLKGHCSSLIE